MMPLPGVTQALPVGVFAALPRRNFGPADVLLLS